MDATEALEILKQYKAWKADPTATGMPDPKELGQAIDAAAHDFTVCSHDARILSRYNAWRRDSDGIICPTNSEIRAAIDNAITMWGG